MDDVFLLTSCAHAEILDVFNGWHPSIQFDHTGVDCVNYLDLTLWDEAGKIRYTLFDKPLNLHMYVPANSCHPSSVGSALLIGGMQRIWAKSSLERRSANERAFYKRLYDRGYSKVQIQRVLAKHSAAASTQKTRKVFLKLAFASNLRVGSLRCIARVLDPLLNSCLE